MFLYNIKYNYFDQLHVRCECGQKNAYGFDFRAKYYFAKLHFLHVFVDKHVAGTILENGFNTKSQRTLKPIGLTLMVLHRASSFVCYKLLRLTLKGFWPKYDIIF